MHLSEEKLGTMTSEEKYGKLDLEFLKVRNIDLKTRPGG